MAEPELLYVILVGWQRDIGLFTTADRSCVGPINLHLISLLVSLRTSMNEPQESVASLRAQIEATEAQLARLKLTLAISEESANKSESARLTDDHSDSPSVPGNQWPLLQEEYRRYGRQMIVPEIGLQGQSCSALLVRAVPNKILFTGQLKLRSAKVLLVGAGGLGCPAAQYLAGAGVGTLGLIDGDTVEISNLHRQVLHRGRNVGKFKVDSAIESLRE